MPSGRCTVTRSSPQRDLVTRNGKRAPRSGWNGWVIRICGASTAPGAFCSFDEGQGRIGREILQAELPCRRRFHDDLEFNEQLAEWTATVADVRVHGTTHERPIDRFARERAALVPALAGRAFLLEAPLTRIVASDYLVSVDTNRYSVPFTLIGQSIEVRRSNGWLEMRHRGEVIARHPVLGAGASFGSCPSTARERSPAMRACATRPPGSRPAWSRALSRAPSAFQQISTGRRSRRFRRRRPTDVRDATVSVIERDSGADRYVPSRWRRRWRLTVLIARVNEAWQFPPLARAEASSDSPRFRVACRLP